jgi:serine/threonine-protein kinase
LPGDAAAADRSRAMASAADSNLLFGMIALQVGLIDQAELVAAFQAWTRDKARPLAEHLAARDGLDVDGRAAVEAMVAFHLKKHGGDTEKSLASIPAGASTRESLARIGDGAVAASIVHLGPARKQAETVGDRTATYSVGAATSDGLRFRILRPHAQGGLGAVFIALDTELHREVALKQMLDHHADDETSRQRFLMEAEITGSLEHPGIVPVYGLGSYGDGRPYYAMRFIKGDSLKEAIDRFHGERGGASAGRRSRRGARPSPVAFRQLLRRFVDVCNAVEYAHSRGILHRDIKPSNIIVGRHGETLMVDWGLAKPLGRVEPASAAGERTLLPSSASGSAETLPGSALGTPAYMSPEQAAGEIDRLGPRSDVYSLGATLYYLLTRIPPLEGDDVGELLRRTQRGEIARPRQLDPGIDRALEAICLKAMATKPEDRYASCRALAEEIDRWMADEPVAAYREPLSRRARRWANRNRTAMTAAAVALLAGVVGLSAVLAVQTRAKADVARALASETRANAALAGANAELTRSRAAVQVRFDLAIDAIKTFHTGVSGDFLLKEEKFKDLRNRLLKSASDFYGKLGKLLEGHSDAASRQALGHANFEVAELIAKVGNVEDAIAEHRRVLAYREELSREPEAAVTAELDVARSALALGALLADSGKSGEALKAYERAETILDGLDRGEAGEVAVRGERARSQYRLGRLLDQSGRLDESSARLQRARSIQEKLTQGDSANNELRSDLARTINEIGRLHYMKGQFAEALAAFKQCKAIRQSVADANPNVTQFQTDLAVSYSNVGSLLQQLGNLALALTEYEHARVINEALVAANPAVSQFQNELAWCRSKLGYALEAIGKTTEALAAHEAARDINQKLVDANPTVSQFQSELAENLEAISGLLFRTGKPAEALTVSEAARSIRQKLADANPAVAGFQSNLASSHNAIGLYLYTAGKPAEAMESYNHALAVLRRLADANPSVTAFRLMLARTHSNCGDVLARTGKPTEAMTAFGRAREIHQRLVDRNPAVSDFRYLLANDLNQIGFLLSQTGQPSQALVAHEKARSILQELADAQPSITQYREVLAHSDNQLGMLLLNAKKPAAALAAHQRARALRQALADAEPRNPNLRRSVGMSLNNLGDVYTQTSRLDKAVEILEQSCALHEKLVRDHATTTDFQSGLAFALTGLGRAHFRAGRFAEAAEPLKRAIALRDALPYLNIEARYDLARDHALLAGLAAKTNSGPSATVANEAGRAMDALRRACAAGYRDLEQIRTDPDLEPLRGREDFQLLMLDQAIPAEAFAKGE